MIILTEKEVMVTSHQLGLVVSLYLDGGPGRYPRSPDKVFDDGQVDLNACPLPEFSAGRPLYEVECITSDALAFVDLLRE